MNLSAVYLAGVLLSFIIGLGLLIRARALGKRLVLLYLLTGGTAALYGQAISLDSESLSSARNMNEVIVGLALPLCVALVAILLLNGAANRFLGSRIKQCVSAREIAGTALCAHLLSWPLGALYLLIGIMVTGRV